MSQRFFLSTIEVGERAILTGPEAHHLAHVMRAKPGELLTLFNGTNWEYSARIESVGKSQVEVTVLEGVPANREPFIELTLAVALPKGDRQKWLVEKAVELGVTTLTPLLTERSVAAPSDSALLRLRRAVIEASKQCGRNQLMEIAVPQRWSDYVSSAAADVRFFAHPGGVALAKNLLRPEMGEVSPKVIGAIGPEGGLADAEVSAAIAAGWHMVDLGPSLLRVETAAIAVAAWVALAGMRC